MIIVKLYNKIIKYYNRDRSQLNITPFRDWSVILFASVIMIVFVIFFTRYLFINIYLKSFEESIIDQQVVIQYDIENFRKELFKVLQYYENKEHEHNSCLENPPLFGEDSKNVEFFDTSEEHDFPEGIKIAH